MDEYDRYRERVVLSAFVAWLLIVLVTVVVASG